MSRQSHRRRRKRKTDIISDFATDGRIPAYDLVVLEDDKGFFPVFEAAPLVSMATLRKYPQLEDVLNKPGGRISPQQMQQLNHRADDPRRDAGAVAREYLVEQGQR